MSIVSSSHARSERQKGFVLVSVLLIAVLYFGAMTLVLLESSEALRSAQQFRSRIAADLLAESGAELAARGMLVSGSRNAELDLPEGSASGRFQSLGGGRFEIRGSGVTAGVQPRRAEVHLVGRVAGNRVRIERASHTRR
ncbi:MAG TPA: hypothetical protein VM534_08045 [Thermoanaerobaculia bacterium]|nr:hypothetical protein [Thermoanaerobaculia bacterium]